MILLRVTSPSKQQLLAIAALLHKEQLAIDMNLRADVERITFAAGAPALEQRYLLTGKTKAALFATIDNLLRETYASDLPEVFSLPIVHMDWEQSAQLSREIKMVQVPPPRSNDQRDSA